MKLLLREKKAGKEEGREERRNNRERGREWLIMRMNRNSRGMLRFLETQFGWRWMRVYEIKTSD